MNETTIASPRLALASTFPTGAVGPRPTVRLLGQRFGERR